MSDYVRARDALIAVREVPGGGELACQLFDQIGDVAQHGAMVATTLEAERLVKAYDPLQPRQPRGTRHGGEWTRLQHARGPFAPRRIAAPEPAAPVENRYWHITHDPAFKIDPTRAPTDASSISAENRDPGLMVTQDPHYWASMFHSHPDELGVEYSNPRPRRYAAEIDVSNVPADRHWDVNRGFGHEHWVDAPASARVVQTVPIRRALAIQDARDAAADRAYLRSVGSGRRAGR